jgi:hypothetical protein
MPPTKSMGRMRKGSSEPPFCVFQFAKGYLLLSRM